MILVHGDIKFAVITSYIVKGVVAVTYRRTIFNFSKTPPTEVVENGMIDEFMKLREIAVRDINQYFEIWKGLYAKKLDKYGLTESVFSEMELYDYSISEMKKIIKKVNDSQKTFLVKLDCDESGYLIGRSLIDEKLIMTMVLQQI